MPLSQFFTDEILCLRRKGAEASVETDRNRMLRLAERAARSNMPVLIEGEAGVGQDALARAIHECGERAGRPFIRLHCAALADAGQEMFSATMSAAQRRDKTVEAQGGTLVLEDVHALLPPLQTRLLRSLQDSEIASSSLRKKAPSDIRVIATSSADLLERVRQGHFREDLYYRLHVLPITMQPLRTRREDIPRLARFLMRQFALQEGKPVTDISTEALSLLTRYSWPGNARQLQNAMFRSIILAESETLTEAEFPQLAAQVEGFEIRIPPAPASISTQAHSAAKAAEDIRVEMRDPRALSLMDEAGELRRLEDLETEIIRFALNHYRGRMSAVSRRLGIGRSTLYRKLKNLGLEDIASDEAARTSRALERERAGAADDFKRS